MKTLLNRIAVDTTKQPLFLGEDLSIQRYDRFKYEIFFKLYRKQIELLWTPEEIELKKDRNDFKNLTDNEKFIFTSNLRFQTLLDSVIARGVPTLLEYVTNPELEACLGAWGFFEILHSYSYTYIIKNVYSNPGEILDGILEDNEIINRAESAVREYDKLKFIGNSNIKDIKKQIYLTLVSINLLEGLRFYISFVCAFVFGENKKMMGNADIIKLIKRDEGIHVSITQQIIKILREEKVEGFQRTIKENEQNAVDLFKHGAEEEKAWAEYLFKDGSLLGLNKQVLSQYIEWLTDFRLAALGLPKIFNQKTNPLAGWLDNWMDSGRVQVAPQESEITSYKIGAFKNDLEGADFSRFKL